MEIEHSLPDLKPVACQKPITGNSSCTLSIYPVHDQSSLCDMMLPVLLHYHTLQLLMLQPLWHLCRRQTYLNSLTTDLQCSCTGQTVTILHQAMNLSQSPDWVLQPCLWLLHLSKAWNMIMASYVPMSSGNSSKLVAGTNNLLTVRAEVTAYPNWRWLQARLYFGINDAMRHTGHCCATPSSNTSGSLVPQKHTRLMGS